MCGIAGFSKIGLNFLKNKKEWNNILNNMNKVQKHRGPDDSGVFIKKECALCHVRLSIVDLENATQPMTRRFKFKTSTIVYNGEIYNTKELRDELKQFGVKFKTTSDTEVVLMGHMIFGEDFVKKLNGIFAYAIWDDLKKELMICRDRIGVKPLFYTFHEGFLIFSSEIKGIFEFPGVKRRIDREGLCEIFGLGPAKSLGKGVFKDIFELLPGNFLKFSEKGITQVEYWRLISRYHTDSFKETIAKTRFLVEDAVKRQLISDVPVCTFLSGGLDSSIITAICSAEFKKQQKQIDTFSFDYVDNKKYFMSNSFQPSEDRPYVEKMVKFLGTNHTYLECDMNDLILNLFSAVDAKDLPCMADVESSLLYFCFKVSTRNKVALTGECADEIFGGYPWFYKQKMFNAKTFPWSLNLNHRKILLSDSVVDYIKLDEYVKVAYQKTIDKTPKLFGESKEERRRREMFYLNFRWFMMTLLDRMDRTSMFSGLEARVPFADHRILEYVFNVPWKMKCCGSYIKGLLRKVGEKYLPKEILYRKKSPYPKTNNPQYENTLKNMMFDVINNSNSPILNFFVFLKVKRFLNIPSNYKIPWYGQLMAGPQMIAYMLQVNYWLSKYKIEIV